PAQKRAYALCFAAVALAGVGSTWFHLAPDAGRLAWDRLPIALGFMALLAAVIGERVSTTAGRNALAPLLVAAAASVLYWRWSMLYGTENIVPYAVVQYGGLAAIVALAMLRSRYTRGGDLLVVAAIYAAAKIFEMLDGQIYALGTFVSGHTLKHLLAALAVCWLVRMLQLRQARAI
ncbi:MAG TPA: alkaline phytoceramidase, partial [Gammaproteobacteria bacterium]|nr:alkaline phytoceramidase [Gammaproteobacteria bacterium]